MKQRWKYTRHKKYKSKRASQEHGMQ